MRGIVYNLLGSLSQAKLKLSVPKYPMGSDMILKDAIYSHNGAKLAIAQDRYPLPYRDPQVCMLCFHSSKLV